MKRIILMRHSYTEPAYAAADDFTRKLNPMGIERIETQLKLFKKLQLVPDVIYSSNAERAKQTAELFGKALQRENVIRFEPFLYYDYTTQDFFDFINQWSDEYETIMVIGHNPTLTTMAFRLDSSILHTMNPCTILLIECKAECWSKIEVGCGVLSHELT